MATRRFQSAAKPLDTNSVTYTDPFAPENRNNPDIPDYNTVKPILQQAQAQRDARAQADTMDLKSQWQGDLAKAGELWDTMNSLKGFEQRNIAHSDPAYRDPVARQKREQYHQAQAALGKIVNNSGNLNRYRSAGMDLSGFKQYEDFFKARVDATRRPNMSPEEEAAGNERLMETLRQRQADADAQLVSSWQQRLQQNPNAAVPDSVRRLMDGGSRELNVHTGGLLAPPAAPPAPVAPAAPAGPAMAGAPQGLLAAAAPMSTGTGSTSMARAATAQSAPLAATATAASAPAPVPPAAPAAAAARYVPPDTSQAMNATQAQAYFSRYPDVAAAYQANTYGMTPEQFATNHYRQFGQGEGRQYDPSPNLSADVWMTYLRSNRDVFDSGQQMWASGENPTAQLAAARAQGKDAFLAELARTHYERFGRAEGRPLPGAEPPAPAPPVAPPPPAVPPPETVPPAPPTPGTPVIPPAPAAPAPGTPAVPGPAPAPGAPAAAPSATRPAFGLVNGADSAILREMDPADETVEGRVARLLSENSPVLQQAANRALQAFNERGLLNTSMAQQAALEAMTSKAIEIAGPDAAAYLRQGLTNQDVQARFRENAQQQGFTQANMNLDNFLRGGLLDKEYALRGAETQKARDFESSMFDKKTAIEDRRYDRQLADQLSLIDRQQQTNLLNQYTQFSTQTYDQYLLDLQEIQASDMTAEVKAQQIQQLNLIYSSRQQYGNALFSMMPQWRSEWGTIDIQFGSA